MRMGENDDDGEGVVTLPAVIPKSDGISSKSV